MGYSERLCQICGVSFNIARIRTATEPRSAAWDYYGGDSYVKFYPQPQGQGCQPSSGCMVLDRAEDDAEDTMITPFDENGTIDTRIGYDDGYEHIAGPGCAITQGYSGWRISLEEMRNCATYQCLVRKRKELKFKVEDWDEEFEVEGNWFLSGLEDWMPDVEGVSDVIPARHGVIHPFVSNTISGGSYSMAKETCMPFHPWCLEVWKRVSGSDIDGLMGWYENESTWDLFHKFPRNGPVTRLQEQWWRHEPGTEWLVANPLFMPGLQGVLQAAVEDDDFDSGRGAFELKDDEDLSGAKDCFATFPTEIRLLILSDLSSKDIANLRLASRCFRQLPVHFWHQLVLKEMPWLWEAWTDPDIMSYSFWATANQAELEANARMHEHSTQMPRMLPPTRTNWYMLYLNIKRHWGSLRGLQNRERIWNDCVEIMRRIHSHRSAGNIPVPDIVALVERREEEQRRNREIRNQLRARVVTHTAPA